MPNPLPYNKVYKDWKRTTKFGEEPRVRKTCAILSERRNKMEK